MDFNEKKHSYTTLRGHSKGCLVHALNSSFPNAIYGLPKDRSVAAFTSRYCLAIVAIIVLGLGAPYS